MTTCHVEHEMIEEIIDGREAPSNENRVARDPSACCIVKLLA
jgi:hypothetical protein